MAKLGNAPPGPLLVACVKSARKDRRSDLRNMERSVMSSSKVRVGIVGVGNCASSFVQGLSYYQDAKSNEPVPGLMNVELGGYHIGDIEIASAFDVNASKVGKDVSEAIAAEPNNTFRFSKVPRTGVR